MKPKIIRVGHVGASIERGWVYSPDGVMGTVTATCYKGPPLILANTSVFITLEDKNDYAEPKRN